VALGSSSLPKAQQSGHLFIACSASARARGNRGCCWDGDVPDWGQLVLVVTGPAWRFTFWQQELCEMRCMGW